MFKYLITLLILVRFSFSSKLPSFITPCAKNLDEIEQSRCTLAEATRILKQFCKGIPELGVESIDPMNVGEYTISAASVNIVQRNVVVKGTCKAYIKEIVLNRETGTGRIVSHGNFSASSDYDINGRLLIFSIVGKGKFKVKMDDTELSMYFKLRVKTSADKKEYYEIYDGKSSHNIGNAKIRMEGLFGNDPALGNTINQVLNENWREIMKEFGPPAIKAVTNKTVDILNSLFAAVPIQDLYA